jgi:hypothetical protein
MTWFNYQYNLSRRDYHLFMNLAISSLIIVLAYPGGRYTTLIVTPLAMTICVLLVLINGTLKSHP